MANTFRHGQVKIANEILDQLAVRASEEISGVQVTTHSDNKINLEKQQGPKSAITEVDGKLIIDLTVNLSKNINVRKTVKAVQENVIRVIESMTGIPVARVNVTVPRLDI